jgi:hypothetical protein
MEDKIEVKETKFDTLNNEGERTMSKINDKNDVKEMSGVNNAAEEPVAAVEGATKMPKRNSRRAKTNSADAKYEEMTLALADIQKDDMFRRRLKEDEANIEKLIGLYGDNIAAEEAKEKPPHKIDLILVWHDVLHGRYVLLGGYHRLEALRRLGITEFRVHALHGSEDVAFAAASHDNTKHGKELKKCDKKYSVLKSLKRYGDTKTFQEIASEVGCMVSYVSKIYKELFGRGKKQAKQNNIEHSVSPPGSDSLEQVNSVPTDHVPETNSEQTQSIASTSDDSVHVPAAHKPFQVTRIIPFHCFRHRSICGYAHNCLAVHHHLWSTQDLQLPQARWLRGNRISLVEVP